MNRRSFFVVLFAFSAIWCFGQVEFGTPFSDGAVLQRDRSVPIWGTAAVGETVQVSFAGQVKTAVADTNGAWRVTLDPMPASKEGRNLSASTSTSNLNRSNVLVGEVWFAAGQSNMECPIWGENPRYRDFAGGLVTSMTRLPSVRYAKVPKAWNVRPQPVKAVWKPFVPASFASDKLTLSAVAFYYACELHHALGVPVGIVDASWGGTGIDAWTPRCGYEGCDPSLKAFAEYPVRADWTKEGETLAAINGPHQQPTVIWNAMVDVWTPMAMRGFIWYQGCHDSGDADLYAAKMHALYDGWSKAFANPALKLYFVQLAPYSTSWMKLAAAQNRFAAEEPNAALAVTADVGNFDDIHPNRKEIVAKRLAVHALKRDYGFDIPEDDSPTFRRAVAEGAEAVLTFDHVRNWYVYDEDSTMDPPFELAGDDGVWKPARIRNKTNRKKWFGGVVTGVELRLAADGVDAPTRVRYMGRDRTKGTLFNEASLPLGPFEAVVQKETK